MLLLVILHSKIVRVAPKYSTGFPDVETLPALLGICHLLPLPNFILPSAGQLPGVAEVAWQSGRLLPTTLGSPPLEKAICKTIGDHGAVSGA